MTAIQIVEEYLKKNNYEGLYTVDCGCELADLAPCGEYFAHCEPGIKVECDENTCHAGGDCCWHIGPR